LAAKPDTRTQAQRFRDYVADKRVLIADTSATSRASLAQVLISMGARQGNVALASSYAAAEEELAGARPQILIADYDLGRRCGLDLLQKLRARWPETKDSLFILVTGNTSQSAVAKAAEEDVDTYILKPFTAEILMRAIERVALLKLEPPAYLREIEAGKALLADGKIDAAVRAFEKARKLDPQPSLACFYLGQAEFLRKMLEGAQGKYEQGLTFQKIHYKCMVGLYEVLVARGETDRAYEVIKRVSRYFPANPTRLTATLRLAILTGSYDDVERYYQVFTQIDERNEEMIKYVCAALVVCGKYYLQKNHPTRATELFQKAAITSSGRARVLREIIGALVEAGMPQAAGDFLKRFPPEVQDGPDYLAMALLIAEADGTGRVLDRGRELIARGVQDPVVYQVMIRASVRAGLASAAEDLVKAAARLWPEQATQFSLLASGRSPA
jgi:two-component system, chemotaxis family, chemotaxis protein CheY